MRKDTFKEQFAKATAKAFQDVYPEKFALHGVKSVFNWKVVFEDLEKPKDPSQGRFALPVFKYARLLEEKPDVIASKLQAVSPPGTLAVGGYLNIKINFRALAEETINKILSEGCHYADSDEGRGKTYLIEYSSPNIAKPFGVGHLRTTILGNSLRRIFRKLGYHVVGINYLGDWGTQFGKMIVAFQKWGENVNLNDNAVEKLYGLYVRFHEEAEKDDSLDEQARQAFKHLEEGQPEEQALWEKFKTISIAEFDRTYERLGVEFDFVTGESFLNDKMQEIITRLQKARLTTTSQGALIVDLDDPQLPPCLLKKADGATLYATRDLAGLVYRWETYRFHESLYVVATSQSDHFKQAFKVIAMLEEAEKLPESERMTGKVRHVDFGWVKFGDRTMSTRRGNIIFLEDVLQKAVNLAKERIREKNPDLEAVDETSQMIGVGAVVFSQFSAKRQKDINFVWEEVLNFDGETGPYLQYTHARLCSLMRRFEKEITPPENWDLLSGVEERRVVELLADFPESVSDAARNYDPYFVSSHLLKLAAAFNKFYQRKDAEGRIDKIISDNQELSAARMALVKAVQIVVNEGLHLLGLRSPQEM